MTMTQESGSRPSCPDDVVFRHEPLPDVSSYIRLLKVVDVDEYRDIAVQCRLTIHNVKVDRIPPYYAISYTWGDPEPTTSIMVNGSRFEVRRNCENVLMQAKWVVDSHAHDQNDHHRYYVWCDAVCINQDDDEEKGHQVAMVGDVYQRAERVLACIYYDDRHHHHRTGPISTPRDEDEEFLFDVVRINEQYLHGVCDSLQAEDDLLLSGNWSAVAMLELAKRRNLKELENLVAQRLFEPKAQEQPSHIMMMTRLYKGIASLAKQDYFQRLWVYQELYLGEHVLLCCGKDRHVSLRALYPLVHVGLSYFAKVRTKFRSWYLPGDSFISIIEAPRLDLALPLIAAGAFHPRLTNNPKARKMPLDALLRIGVRLHCKDQRDKIYGILSMVYWGDDVVPIYPDYKLDAFDLAVTVVAKLQALLSHGIGTSSYIHDNAVPAMEDQKFREIMEPLAVLMRLQDQPSERLARAVQERQRSSPAPMRTVPNESLVCNNKWWTEKPRNPLMLACLGFSIQRAGNKWTLESASPSDIWHAHVMRESKDLKDEMDLLLPPFTQNRRYMLDPRHTRRERDDPHSKAS